MANLKEVRTRIQSVKSTQQITKAMKMVAASKLRKAQDAIVQMRPYVQKLGGIMRNASANLDGEQRSPYSVDRIAEKVLIVVITSDRGLCGAFNTNVIKATLATVRERYDHQSQQGNVWYMPLGKKAYDFFTKRGYQVIDDYYHIFHELSFDKAREIAGFAMDAFLDGKFDRVEIVYNEFKNVATQILKVEQFLPVVPAEYDEETATTDYIFEPSVKEIIEELIPISLKVQLYNALLESNASEHGARMTAMGQATENAGELLNSLKLVYNRTRQAAITKEILEIVGGAEALGKN
ncbi:MAG: ATP synthase F1 subunit gamma [Cyclobacteriaceae bacterium]|nr:ATP synthase F1 subunit gamma [Cyclobacteriaceae bacterium]